MLNYTAQSKKPVLTANINKNGLTGIVWLLCFISGIGSLKKKVRSPKHQGMSQSNRSDSSCNFQENNRGNSNLKAGCIY